MQLRISRAIDRTKCSFAEHFHDFKTADNFWSCFTFSTESGFPHLRGVKRRIPQAQCGGLSGNVCTKIFLRRCLNRIQDIGDEIRIFRKASDERIGGNGLSVPPQKFQF